MAVGVKGLVRLEKLIKTDEGSNIGQTTRDMYHGTKWKVVYDQVEQEVCYDASLFNPSKSLSLNVEGA